MTNQPDPFFHHSHGHCSSPPVLTSPRVYFSTSRLTFMASDPVVPQILPDGYVLSEKKTHADFTKPIESSLNDDRLYRLIRLNNDLEVLLIQDPTVDKSAAALDVHVGHLSDPVSLHPSQLLSMDTDYLSSCLDAAYEGEECHTSVHCPCPPSRRAGECITFAILAQPP